MRFILHEQMRPFYLFINCRMMIVCFNWDTTFLSYIISLLYTETSRHISNCPIPLTAWKVFVSWLDILIDGFGVIISFHFISHKSIHITAIRMIFCICANWYCVRTIHGWWNNRTTTTNSRRSRKELLWTRLNKTGMLTDVHSYGQDIMC